LKTSLLVPVVSQFSDVQRLMQSLRGYVVDSGTNRLAQKLGGSTGTYGLRPDLPLNYFFYELRYAIIFYGLILSIGNRWEIFVKSESQI
jgi:hypothetical protein